MAIPTMRQRELIAKKIGSKMQPSYYEAKAEAKMKRKKEFQERREYVISEMQRGGLIR